MFLCGNPILRPIVEHLTILASFPFRLITFPSVTGQVSLPYSITLQTHEEYNLLIAAKAKHLLANKGTKSSELIPSTPHPCYNSTVVEYCCHVGAGAPSCYLELLDKLQNRICWTVGPSLTALLNSWLIVEM